MKRYSDDAYFEDTDEIPDGFGIKVPMRIMDGKPHFASLTDSQITRRAQARDEYVKDLTEAWRSPRTRPDDIVRSGRTDDRTAAYDAYVKRISNAWRTPPHRDAAEPDSGSRPEELMRKHLTTEPDRDAAYSAYKDRISNAWKSPAPSVRTAPMVVGAGPDAGASATAIEKQGEQWRGGR